MFSIYFLRLVVDLSSTMRGRFLFYVTCSTTRGGCFIISNGAWSSYWVARSVLLPSAISVLLGNSLHQASVCYSRSVINRSWVCKLDSLFLSIKRKKKRKGKDGNRKKRERVIGRGNTPLGESLTSMRALLRESPFLPSVSF